MEVLQALEERKSIRSFKATLVPNEIIEKIIKYATYAPSARNMQPWEYTVVTGETKKKLSEKLLELQKERDRVFGPKPETMPDLVQKRLNGFMDDLSQYYKKIGIPVVPFNPIGNLTFHNAPQVVIIGVDKAMKPYSMDIGITLAYFLLAAHSMGIATCPIGVVRMYQKEINEFLGIPENKQLIISIAIGYPDFDNPISGFKTRRDDLKNLVIWK